MATLVGDPGSTVVQGARSFSEWGVRIRGAIATCVEASELVLLNVKQGVPLTASNDLALAEQLQQMGLADWRGATNWAAASKQLTQHGVANKAYGPGDIGQAGIIQLLIANAGKQPILLGVPAAHNLKDDWTGNYYNADVNGHAIVVVGMDRLGFIVADPNTPQSQTGEFVHYSIGSLRAAGVDSIVIPTGPSLGGPGGGVAPDPLTAAVQVTVNKATTVPGFAPIAQALDDAEQFYAFDLSQPVHSIVRNIGAGLVRGVIVLLGLILIILVIFSLLRRAEPQIAQAGQLAAIMAE